MGISDLKKLLFIYNPNSGHANIGQKLNSILKAFEDADYIPTVYRMRYGGDASDAAEKWGAYFDLVVCAGGDGTLNGVVSGLMRIEKDRRPPVGFIPTGSANDTRASYAIPQSIAAAARLVVTGEPFETDIGDLSGRYFNYVASFGELSAVSCFTPQENKNVFGRGAYIAEGLRALVKMHSDEVAVRYDGKELKGDFFLGMVTNATSVGGFDGIVGKNVDLQDGLFEVTLVKRPADLAEFSKEVQAVLIDPDKSKKVEKELVIRFTASEISFEADNELQWVVDGEDAGKHRKVTAVNLNRAVRIIAGARLTDKVKTADE